MNREIKVGDWGWFWDDNHEDVLFGQLVNICDGLNGMFDTFDSRHYHFSHEHPTGRFIVTENPNSVSNDPYAELKKAYESKDLAVIEPALEKINEAWKVASEEMYKAQQEAQAGAGAQQGQPE